MDQIWWENIIDLFLKKKKTAIAHENWFWKICGFESTSAGVVLNSITTKTWDPSLTEVDTNLISHVIIIQIHSSRERFGRKRQNDRKFNNTDVIHRGISFHIDILCRHLLKIGYFYVSMHVYISFLSLLVSLAVLI